MDQFQLTSFSLKSTILALAFLTVTILNNGCTVTETGWRTAQWNICTVASYLHRNGESVQSVDCRTIIDAEDTTRTLAHKERLFIAQTFFEDDNMYSFTLQEICEEDLRWIAAYVANGGEPTGGPYADFSPKQYFNINTHAPYTFLAYRTREMILAATPEHDEGCGVGISTGFGVIAKHLGGEHEIKLQGMNNWNFASREDTGLTDSILAESEICDAYFDWQTSTDTLVPGSKPPRHDYSMTFTQHTLVGPPCAGRLPDTLRGVACVRTWWSGPGDDGTRYRVSTCSTHAISVGYYRVRNHQMDEAATMTYEFAGGENQRAILSGDFNVYGKQHDGASGTDNLDDGITGLGHTIILTDYYIDFGHNFELVATGVYNYFRNGTEGPGTQKTTCTSNIDGIYAINWDYFNSTTPHENPSCSPYGEGEPGNGVPSDIPSQWSDHILLKSSLMSPHP